MSNKLYNETSIQNIADAIREKGITGTMTVSQMAGKILDIPSGGTLITKTITQNGTYNASDDNADGYSQVTVDVSGGGLPELPFPSEWSGASFTLDQDYQISKPDHTAGEAMQWWLLPEGYTLTIPDGRKLIVQESANEFCEGGALIINGYFVCYSLITIDNPTGLSGLGTATLYLTDNLKATGDLQLELFNSTNSRNIECKNLIFQGTFDGMGNINAISITVAGTVSFLGYNVICDELFLDVLGIIKAVQSINIHNQLVSIGGGYSIIVKTDNAFTYSGDEEAIYADYPFIMNRGGTVVGVPAEYIDNCGGGITSFTLEPNHYYDVLDCAEVILEDGSRNLYLGDFGYAGILVPNITPTILRQIRNRQKDVFISVYISLPYQLPHFEFFTNAGNEAPNFEPYLLSTPWSEFPYGDQFYIRELNFAYIDGLFFVTTNNEWFLPIDLDYSFRDSIKINVSIIDRASE